VDTEYYPLTPNATIVVLYMASGQRKDAVMNQKIYPGLFHIILDITHPEFDPVGNVIDVARDHPYE
jgi:hypothetical protein